MFEKRGRGSHPSGLQERVVANKLEERTFVDRSAATEALRAVGAQKWCLNYIKATARERRLIATGAVEGYNRQLFKTFRNSFYSPLERNGANLFNNERQLTDIAFAWFGMNWILESASDKMARRYRDTELVPYVRWNAKAVIPRLAGRFNDSVLDNLLETVQQPDLYHRELQWGAYAYGVGLNALEDIVCTEVDGAEREQAGELINFVVEDNVHRYVEYVSGFDPRPGVAVRLASRAFSYTPEQIVDATTKLNEVASKIR